MGFTTRGLKPGPTTAVDTPPLNDSIILLPNTILEEKMAIKNINKNIIVCILLIYNMWKNFYL